jgi:hypothetical protein
VYGRSRGKRNTKAKRKRDTKNRDARFQVVLSKRQQIEPSPRVKQLHEISVDERKYLQQSKSGQASNGLSLVWVPLTWIMVAIDPIHVIPGA